MNNKISKNVENIEISGIRKFFNKVSEIEGAISLTLGQPDFKVPSRIKDSMIKAINDDRTVYTSNAGILELRKEICKYLETMDINYSPEEVCITVGGSEGLFSVFTSIINVGDEVLIPTPAYPAYESCVKILGGKVINYKLKEDFSIDFDYLRKIIKERKPKCMVLSYPSNPTGATLSKSERDELYSIIKNEDIFVISDEIYSAICYDEKYYSIAQYTDIKEKIILISGFSKMFSMTGLRVGYVCSYNTFINSIIKAHQYNVSCAPSIAQFGALEGLKTCMNDVEYMKYKFLERRDFLYNKLNSMGFEVNLPQGAFYMFPSIKKFSNSSEEFCDNLLKYKKVGIVPGSAFGIGGEGFARISYSYSKDKIEMVLRRLEEYINEYK